MKDLQLDFFDIPSPCRGVCKSDNRGYCQGCYRSRDERFHWLEFNKDEKQKIIKLCLQREKRRNKPIKIKEATKEDEFIQPSLLDQPVTSHIDMNVKDDDFGDCEL